MKSGIAIQPMAAADLIHLQYSKRKWKVEEKAS
jgi:hypothetical protein